MPNTVSVNRSYVRLLTTVAALAVLVFGGLAYALLATYYYLAPTLLDVASLRDVRLQVPLRVYSRDGRLLAQIGEQRRIPVTLDQVPPRLVRAFLAAEDERFFQHRGIDSEGLIRAAAVTVASGEARQGGSTITMQLARNMFLTPEKRLRRKLREIFLSLRLENEFSKQEILTLYLNKIFLGQRAYGVAAAAEVYYGKPLNALSLAEMATIAGLPKAPSEINPIASPERARARRAYVLKRMLDLGDINRADYDAAVSAPVESQEHGPRVEIDAPYVAEMVRTEMASRYGEEAYTAGYKVTSTLDSRLQHAADWSVRAALLEYDRRHGYRGRVARVASADEAAVSEALDDTPEVGGLIPAVVTAVGAKSATVRSSGATLQIPWEGGLSWAKKGDEKGNLGPAPRQPSDVVAVGDVVYTLPAGGGQAYLAQVPLIQGAFVALDPQDGAIVALVGGFDYYQSKFNRVVQARRQPGSSFKPFVYSGALEQGFTPATIILDAPVVYEAAGQEEGWRPANDTGHFYGPTSMRDGLARSRNLVSIRILRAIGVDYAVDYATRFGFTSQELPHNLTLALGTAQLTPLEMVSGFAVFANGGFKVRPYLIDRIEDAGDHVLYQADPQFVCRTCPVPPAPPAPPAVPPKAGTIPAVATSDSSRPPPPAPPAPPGSERLAPLVISPANAYLMTDLMRDVIRRGTARRALALNRSDIAGKTGTTNERRDTWFSGFNGELVATAWVGFDQERSLGAGEEGGHTALPMWVYFMGEALHGQPERRLPQPDGIVSARVSPETGQLAKAGDPNAVFELFLAGKVPGAGGLPGDGAAVSAEQQSKDADEPIF
jgi:penicillin-binding protein 1A